ncbi:MAG: amino acid permease, partial [Acidobacteria bacterium]|nr:amino acid permease [Acidobacteriota bacterium]
GAMYPRSGGLYVFLSEAYNPLFGFLYGWACMLVILTGAQATVSVGFATYFSYFFPSLSTGNILFTMYIAGFAWKISAGQLVAAAITLIVGIINYRGVGIGTSIQSLFTFLAAAALAVLPILAFAFSKVTPEFTPVFPAIPMFTLAKQFGIAMVAVMWTYEAWYYVAFASGEIKEPARNVPRALVLGILALTAIYVSANLSYIYALPLQEIIGVDRIASKAVSALVGSMGAAIVAATVSISTFGCNAAGAIAMSRTCYAMAVDGVFIRSCAKVHPEYKTPHIAVLFTTGWAIFLTLTGSYEQLFTYVTFASLLFGIGGGLAIFVLRIRKPEKPRPYRAWGYPLVPAFFVLGSLILVVNTLYETPKESGAGLILVALGIPAYFFWRK